MPEHDMPAMCSMNMLFNWQIKDVCVVFEWWHIQTAMDLLLTCVAIFCIAAGYEYLRVWSSSFDEQWVQADKKRSVDDQNMVGSSEDAYEESNAFLRKDIGSRLSNRQELLRSTLYAVLVGISFWLMLVFMTYNGYLMIATVLGAGFGHFIFGRGKLSASRDIQCH
ncbi:Ctr copper transporter [Backusella circina FSU 941]|nr:Ctr copper transporter [Backusella circina FSU 941]